MNEIRQRFSRRKLPMSVSIPENTLFRRMRFTAMRDAIRRRWTNRLDWRGHPVAAEISPSARRGNRALAWHA